MPGFTLNDFILAFLVLIGSSIGGYWSYRGSQDAIKNQLKNEKKNVAKAIDIDLKNISESVFFSIYYDFYKNDRLKKGDRKPSREIIIPDKENKKFIDKNTILYSVFNHDIAKFDNSLSSKIYEFYSNLFLAEDYRIFVLQNKDSDSEYSKKEVESFYTMMRKLIIECGNKIQEIRDELKKVYES